MAPIYTLLGVPYVAVLDPERGIVLRKAARKRVASPGQMSLFGSNDPKEGDTKVENGVTYRLNQHSRWERADKAKGKAKAKPKAVVPVVEEKTEVESKPSDIVNMRQEEDTGSRRDETPAMPNFEVVSDRRSQPPGTIFYDDPGVTPEQRAWMEYGGQNYIPATVATRSEIDNTFPNVAQAAAKAREYGYQGADDHEVLARYMAGGATRQVGSQNVYPVYFEAEPEAMPVNEPDDLDQPEASPEPTIGDMLAEQKAQEEGMGQDGRKPISTVDAASALAEAVNGRLWQKKEGEVRIYVSGTNNGYLKIMPETDSGSQVQYFMKSYDIPKVEEAVEAFNREYQIIDGKSNKPKEKTLMHEDEDGVIAPAGQHDPSAEIVREWYE